MKESKGILTILAIILVASNGMAHEEQSEASLAKIATNPIANMISVPFQFNFNFGLGDYNRYGTVLNLQPIIPFRLSDKWNVVNRLRTGCFTERPLKWASIRMTRSSWGGWFKS